MRGWFLWCRFVLLHRHQNRYNWIIQRHWHWEGRRRIQSLVYVIRNLLRTIDSFTVPCSRLRSRVYEFTYCNNIQYLSSQISRVLLFALCLSELFCLVLFFSIIIQNKSNQIGWLRYDRVFDFLQNKMQYFAHWKLNVRKFAKNAVLFCRKLKTLSQSP